MSQQISFDRFNPGFVDVVLDRKLQPEDKILKSVRQYCREEGLPDIEVSAQQGKMLELLVRTAKARRVLEIGTLGGYSTICLARGAGADGSVTTLEYEPSHAKVARANLSYAGVLDRTTIVIGDAHETLSMFPVATSFDFVFIDADKESNLAYVEWALVLGTDDVTIVVDNVIRDGRVLAPERPEKLEFIDFMSNFELECSVIQTVGSKGWDGFVLARRRGQ